MTWIAIGLGEVRREDERFTPAVPLWSRQWTSRCRRPRKLFYIDFLPNFSRHDLPSASRRRKMLPCTKEEVEALFYFISNLYLTLYPIRTLSIPFPNFTVWGWHKRSLRVNTRLQRESAINTIQSNKFCFICCCPLVLLVIPIVTRWQHVYCNASEPIREPIPLNSCSDNQTMWLFVNQSLQLMIVLITPIVHLSIVATRKGVIIVSCLTS